MLIKTKTAPRCKAGAGRVPCRGENYKLHLLWTSGSPKVGGCSLRPCQGPLTVWATQALYYGPLLCIAQFLSHSLLPYMLPNHSARALCLWDDPNHPLPWHCLCQGVLFYLLKPDSHGPLPIHAVQLFCNSPLSLRATQPRSHGPLLLWCCQSPLALWNV